MVRTSELASSELDGSALDAGEQRRARDLIRAEDRLAFLAGHILLRQLLSEKLGCRPHEVSYVRRPCPVCGGPNGRPVLDRAAHPLHFSMSRSSGLTLVAIASVPVGVDVQALAEPEAASEVGALLHPAEAQEIESAPRSQRAEVFTRIWVRKEAYLKGIGTGVAHDLATNYLGTRGRAEAPQGWGLVDVPVPAGYVAAAATARVNPGPRRRAPAARRAPRAAAPPGPW